MSGVSALELLNSTCSALVKTVIKLNESGKSVEAGKIELIVEALTKQIEKCEKQSLDSWCSVELLEKLKLMNSDINLKISDINKGNKVAENAIKAVSIVEEIISKIANGIS